MATSSCQYQAESTLDSNNLVDVIDILEKCGLPNTRWLKLGLRLGLLKRTLDEIEANYSTADRRLMECLMKWLSRADNVVSRGGPPTWDSLSAALRAMDEIAVADKLDTEKWPQQTATHHSSQVPSLSNPVTDHAKATPNDHVKVSTSEFSTQTPISDSKLQATCYYQTAASKSDISTQIAVSKSDVSTQSKSEASTQIAASKIAVSKSDVSTQTAVSMSEASTQIAASKSDISTQTSNSGSKLQAICTCNYQTAVSKKTRDIVHVGSTAGTGKSDKKYFPVSSHRESVPKQPTQQTAILSNPHSSQLTNPVTGHGKATPNDYAIPAKVIRSEVSTETFTKLQANYQTAVPIKTERRNILVMGKTGTGCSTVRNQLLGTGERFKVSAAPSSEKMQAMPYISEFEYDGTRYEFTVIDTIGLFDTGKISNKDIMKNTKETIKKHVDGLHLVVFVVREGRITDDEKRTFDLIHKHFSKDIDPISMMVITGCEGKDKAAVVNEYRSNIITRDVVDHMKKGVYSVGFSDLMQYSGPIKEIYEQTARHDADMLRKRAIECKEKFLEKKLYDKSWCIIL